MDFRQSEPFAKYLAASGWKTAHLSDGTYVYIFNLPLLGAILRIPRTKPPIKFAEIDLIASQLKAILIKLEPDAKSNDLTLAHQLKQYGYQFDNWSIEPTNTLIVDLKKSEQHLFQNIRSKWQKYIRMSQKSGVKIIQSDDIDTFLKIWQENAALKGYHIERPFKTKIMWEEFNKIGAAKLLLADVNKESVAAASLIIRGNQAHLWHLASKLKFASLHPVRLLIWQSILLAKSLNCGEFDFEGIKDPRLPYTEKLQPTFFKQGFGGFERTYIGSFVKYFKPIHSLPFILTGKFMPQLFRTYYKKFYG